MKTTQNIGLKIFLSLVVILINLLSLPIAIYLLFAFKPGSVISNWDIALSIGFLIVCNIISLQLLIAKKNQPTLYKYAGFILAAVQLISFLLYMNLYTVTAYILFAAAIILSLLLLIMTIRRKDPAFG